VKRRLLEIVQGFKDVTLLVVGDVIADVYVLGNTSRISREAPVLILEFDSEHLFLGGAGNAANNVHACGAKTFLAGVVGKDAQGDAVWNEALRRGIESDCILRLEGVHTLIKTRILAGGRHGARQQIVRVDRCAASGLDDKARSELLDLVQRAAQIADGIIISDYGHGLVSDELFQAVRGIAVERDLPIAVDTRYGLLRYSSITAQTPNETEIEEVLNVPLQTDDARLAETAEMLRKKLSLEAILVTRGSKGMMLVDENGSESIPIFGTDEVADVTGAGDTVVAVFTTALAAGATLSDAAHLANIAGGLVVMKRGTATVSAEELISALNSLQ